MRDTVIMLTAFAAVMGILGYLNSADVQSCMDRGHSFEICNNTFNR
jgi:hypothetical protein